MVARPPILPPRGDCFDSSFRARSPDQRARNEELIAWPRDLLVALHQTLATECGPAAQTILHSAGRTWGRSLAERVSRQLQAYHAVPIQELPGARVQASVASIFAREGWGRVEIDFTRHEIGIIEIRVTNGLSTALQSTERTGAPAPDHLLSGVFSGLFSALTGAKLDCLQTDYEVAGTAPARFVVSLPERLSQVADVARRGQPHDRVVALLETIRA